MTLITFQAPEYTADDSFETHEFSFEGERDRGWIIRRDHHTELQLGKGFQLLRTLVCGVCSTDLGRRFLPHPLPQVIGHEVLCHREGRPVVVEINASCTSRNLPELCEVCAMGMPTQCVDRITLGINRLPGGFAPWLLAPVAGIYPVPEGVGETAVLVEPFAAALHAVLVTPPRSGETVAVLGPRRLGALLIAALAGIRRERNLDFHIVALSRHERHRAMCLELGADRVVDPQQQSGQVDVVFDTTGSPDGFAKALQLARRAVHLKSTHGKAVLGLERLTQLVVDELTLLPLSEDALEFSRNESSTRTNPHIWVSPALGLDDLTALCDPHQTLHSMTLAQAALQVDKGTGFEGSPMKRFDLAVVGNDGDIDGAIRPRDSSQPGLLRPGGALLLAPDGDFGPVGQTILEKGIQIHTSRCGDFAPALALLAAQPDLAETLNRNMMTHHFPLARIKEAFTVAADSEKSIKVLVHNP